MMGGEAVLAPWRSLPSREYDWAYKLEFEKYGLTKRFEYDKYAARKAEYYAGQFDELAQKFAGFYGYLANCDRLTSAIARRFYSVFSEVGAVITGLVARFEGGAAPILGWFEVWKSIKTAQRKRAAPRRRAARPASAEWTARPAKSATANERRQQARAGEPVGRSPTAEEIHRVVTAAVQSAARQKTLAQLLATLISIIAGMATIIGFVFSYLDLLTRILLG